jgi:uncharacterized protein (DUF1501 family)
MIHRTNTACATPAGRREFIKRAGLLTALSGTPLLASLASLGAYAQSTGDFKALVCVFLYGGNDQSNTIVPRTGGAYNAYSSARPTLALPAASLLPVTPIGYSGEALGFAPQLTGLKNLFDSQKCAVLANIGPLVQPTTQAQWNDGSPTVPVPQQLFSHSDQQNIWQTCVPIGSSPTGWLGRMGDALVPAMQPNSPLSICMSLGGDNMIQVGEQVVQYQLTTNGAVKLNQLGGLYGNATGAQALRNILTQTSSDPMQSHYSQIVSRAVDNEVLVSKALAGSTLSTAFPSNPVAQQLKLVARMIKARAGFGHRRQIYFVASGGWDFHDNLLEEQNAKLLALDAALSSFYASTVELDIQNQVTTFTASDFGRALQSNGRGSDHGWGSHQFVVGGAVQGNRIIGAFPSVALRGPEDSGHGNLIPTTAVDQLASTLALWMGVPAQNLADVVPRISEFSSSNLGIF